MNFENVDGFSANGNPELETPEIIKLASDYRALTDNHLAALMYAESGFSVVPCWQGKPRAPISRATANLSQVDAWWRQNPDFDIGLVPAACGMVALQYDVRGIETTKLSFTDEQLEELRQEELEVDEYDDWLAIGTSFHDIRTFDHTSAYAAATRSR